MSLNARKIAIAALDVAEAEGIEGLTMKSIASRLGRKPSSLYNHIASREDLVERMRSLIVEKIDTSSFGSKPWHEALIDWAHSYLAAFAAKPSCIRLLATTPITDVSTLQMYEKVVNSLIEGGWPEAEAVAVMRTVEAHVLGSALDVVAPANLLSTDVVPAELHSLRRALDPQVADSWSAQAAFTLGIHSLVEGLRLRQHALPG